MTYKEAVVIIEAIMNKIGRIDHLLATDAMETYGASPEEAEAYWETWYEERE